MGKTVGKNGQPKMARGGKCLRGLEVTVAVTVGFAVAVGVTVKG